MVAIAGKKILNAAGVSLAVITLIGIATVGYYFGSSPREDIPSVLRVGVLPDENPGALLNRYTPLIDYLANKTGIETRLIIPADYADTLRLFREKQVDLVYFGGLTFVQAESRFDAVPLVMREIDTRFTSWFITRPEMAQLSLKNFNGKKFSFGSKLSTSGHLMPRHFLRTQWQIYPETFFSQIEYSGAHDKTALMVRDGIVDLGAVNSAVIENMLTEGQIKEDELHVLWQTAPYPNYVWAVQTILAEDLKTRLRDLFLGLDADNPNDQAVLKGLNANNYLPAIPEDFTTLNQIAASIELLDPASK